MDVLLRKPGQLREVHSDVLSTGVYKLCMLDWVVVCHRAIDEGTATCLHPVATADTCLKVKQVLLKGLQSVDPAHPEVTTGQEAGYNLSVGVYAGQFTMGDSTNTVRHTPSNPHHILYRKVLYTVVGYSCGIQ